MRSLLSSSLILSMSICASPVCAIVIDDFQSAQFGLVANDSTPDVNGNAFGAPSSILGIERDVRLLRTSTGTSPSTIGFYPGLVQVVSGNSTPVVATFQWDGLADGIKNNIDPAGLSPTNLTFASNLISTSVNNGTAPVSATFTIWDIGGNSASNVLVIPASYSGDLQFYFDDFDNAINFSQARALQLQLTVPMGVSFDINGILQTGYFFNGIPEPTTISLLLPLLGGMVWRRRRRNALAKSA